MLESQKYFLMVVDEMNITRAAEKAYISQQCMSNHIRRLEALYNTRLFNRKPKLSLTPAGERLTETLRQINRLEENFEKELHDVNGSVVNTIHLGITWSRAVILLPPVIAKFKEIYPNIDVNIHNNVTDNLEHRLVSGYLDLAISTGILNSPSLESHTLSEEDCFVVISDELLARYFLEDTDAVKEQFKKGVYLSSFANVPFILNAEDERFAALAKELFRKEDIEPEVVFRSNSADIRSQLCGANMGASIFSELLLQYAIRQNRMQPPENKLNFFPLLGVESDYKMIAFYSRDAYRPGYINVLISLLEQQAQKFKYNTVSF